ncbi:FecR family protein [Gaoshiqia sp. Z1-71]|uniref:FecR family protein n=1 Tax=Gaoshiqia hydrogeniformans TaxID=3290090 RepID=UPI003BF8961E
MAMKKQEEYHKKEQLDWTEIDRFGSRLTTEWEESKEAIWLRMEQKLTAPARPAKVIFFARPAFRLAVAALVVLLVGLGSVMRFHSRTYHTIPGQHLAIALPDGSTVQLNAASVLTFRPYWWRFSRELALEGEAYFQVSKGDRFTVISSNGTTTVLGTSFNIYARDEAYRVSCLTGTVKVTNARGNQDVILSANQKAEWQSSAFVRADMKANHEPAWVNKQFEFTGRPIREVFDEIERQYGIRIISDQSLNFEYSGNFNKEESVHQVLTYICKPFNLNFEEKKTGQYQVLKNQ